MELKRIFILYFSPTGGTRRVARILLDAARKSGAFLEEADLTPPEAREEALEFEAGDLVFWAAPSYGGRLPKPFHDYRGFAGRSAWGVPVAVYGNRHFDDQLAEMQDVMEACGFTVPAGAAFIARHNQHPLLGAGRPDAEDRKAVESFVGLVIEKIRAADAHSDLRVTLPGHRPYKPYGKVAAAPEVVHPEKCHHCGECAESCPMGIIDPITMKVTDAGQCIGCRGCIEACHYGARHFPDAVAAAIAAKLETIYQANTERKAPTICL